MKIIKIAKKIPSYVWVDAENKIAYAKGVWKKPDRLTYHEFREVIKGGERCTVTLPSGVQLKAPFRQLSPAEIATRLNEVM